MTTPLRLPGPPAAQQLWAVGRRMLRLAGELERLPGGDPPADGGLLATRRELLRDPLLRMASVVTHVLGEAPENEREEQPERDEEPLSGARTPVAEPGSRPAAAARPLPAGLPTGQAADALPALLPAWRALTALAGPPRPWPKAAGDSGGPARTGDAGDGDTAADGRRARPAGRTRPREGAAGEDFQAMDARGNARPAENEDAKPAIANRYAGPRRAETGAGDRPVELAGTEEATAHSGDAGGQAGSHAASVTHAATERAERPPGWSAADARYQDDTYDRGARQEEEGRLKPSLRYGPDEGRAQMEDSRGSGAAGWRDGEPREAGATRLVQEADGLAGLLGAHLARTERDAGDGGEGARDGATRGEAGRAERAAGRNAERSAGTEEIDMTDLADRLADVLEFEFLRTYGRLLLP